MRYEILIAIVLGLLRVFGVKHEAFQAVAHLFVGGLFTAWWTTGKRVLICCV